MCRIQTFYYEVCGCIHYRRWEKCKKALKLKPEYKGKVWQGVWCENKTAQRGKSWATKNKITRMDEECPKCITKRGPEDPEEKPGKDKEKRFRKGGRIEAAKRARYRRWEAWEKTWAAMKEKHAAENAENGYGEKGRSNGEKGEGIGENGEGTDAMDDDYEQAIRRAILGTRRPAGQF